jgi:23S rRNA (uracil1939-C5)-methyltransferase
MNEHVEAIGATVEVTMTGLDDQLRGTALWQDLTLHVEGGTPGDTLLVRIDSISRHHPLAYGSIVEVIARGEAFVEPPCSRAAPVRGRCGGCPGMHLSEAAQDAARKAMVEASLEGLEASVVWHASPGRLGYRNRTNLAVTRRRDGDVILGSFAPRSHTVVSMKDCIVVRPVLAQVQEIVRKMITSRELPADDQREALRWVVLRVSEADRVVVELVASRPNPSWAEELAFALMKVKPVRGVALSVTDPKTNAIRDTVPTTLAGDATIRDTFGALTFDIPPGAFTQLNTDVASVMYLRAAELVDNAGIIWDLYGGLGGLGLNVAHHHKGSRVFGADSFGPSIDEANRVAEHHGFDAQYEVIDLGVEFPRDWPAPDTIIVNPPRKGLSDVVLEGLVKVSAPALVYMSCDPKSFARDAARLIAAGYAVETVEVYDMLPQTARVELLARLVKR